jgi:hypothetical protein
MIAEKQFLSVLVHDWRQTNHLLDKVSAEDFGGYDTRKLFNAIYSMRNSVVNHALLAEKVPTVDEILGDELGIPCFAENYIELIKTNRKLRQIQSICDEASIRAKENDDVSSIVSDVTSRLVGMVEVKNEITTDSIISNYRNAANGHTRSIPLPFEQLNHRTGGIRRGMVTVLTGRSKAGKSMLKSFWHTHLGRLGIPTLDCCFEDGIEISKGRCASVGRYNLAELMNGGRFVNEFGAWKWYATMPDRISLAEKCMRELDALPMYWHQRRVAPKDMITMVSEYVRKHKIACVFIDGAKDMLRPSGKHNDCGFEEETSQALVDMAQRLDIAVVVIHHLTKIPADVLVTEGSIRGSGNIISDCRSVYALQGGQRGESLGSYADACHYATGTDAEGYCSVRVFECLATNHGQTGKAWLNTDLGQCNFWKLEQV